MVMVDRSYYAPAKDRNVHKHQNNQPHIKPRENIFGCAGLHCALPAPTPNNKVGGPFCNEEQNDRLNPPTQSSRSERQQKRIAASAQQVNEVWPRGAKIIGLEKCASHCSQVCHLAHVRVERFCAVVSANNPTRFLLLFAPSNHNILGLVASSKYPYSRNPPCRNKPYGNDVEVSASTAY